MIFERIICTLLGHKYIVQRIFHSGARQVGCSRCGREWGMHDETRTFVPWDGDFEDMYRRFGQWPGAMDKEKPNEQQ